MDVIFMLVFICLIAMWNEDGLVDKQILFVEGKDDEEDSENVKDLVSDFPTESTISDGDALMSAMASPKKIGGKDEDLY